MKCVSCDGTGWLKSQAQHPCIKAHICLVTYTKACPVCKGTGHTEEPSLFKMEEVTA